MCAGLLVVDIALCGIDCLEVLEFWVGKSVWAIKDNAAWSSRITVM